MPARAANTVFALTIVLWLGGTALVLADPAVNGNDDYGTPYGGILLSTALLGFVVVGWLVVRRLPGNRAGWSLLSAGLSAELAGALDQAHLEGGTRWWASWSDRAADRAALLFVGALFVAVPWWFPEPRPSSTARRALGWALAAAVGSGVILNFAALVVAAGIVSLGGLVARYPRADPVQRMQLRWLGWPCLAVLFSLLAIDAGGGALGRPTPQWFRVLADLANLLISAVPVGIGIAVLRRRLWVIDSIADRVLVVAAVTAYTSSIYIAVIVGLGSAVGPHAGTGLLVVASTVVALTIEPARRWCEMVVHRLVFGSRPDPYRVLNRFSRRVAEAPIGVDALAACAEAACAAVGAPTAHAWVAQGDRWRLTATWPMTSAHGTISCSGPDDDPTSVLIEHRGVVLGAISVGGAHDLTEDQHRVLTDLAAQSTMLFRSVALEADLQERLTQLSAQTIELHASRQRILAAEESARHRIERDLHDGAQQRLVTLGMSLQRLRIRLDDHVAVPLLDEVAADLRIALGELRELAHGIRPALLVDAGLCEAVRALVERAPVSATLDAEPTRRFQPAVESTAYYVVAEALTNVAKHAPTATARVTIVDDVACVRVAISDDGPGGAAPERGSGLRGLADRAAAIGGTLDVTSAPGEGVTVYAVLPCA